MHVRSTLWALSYKSSAIQHLKHGGVIKIWNGMIYTQDCHTFLVITFYGKSTEAKLFAGFPTGTFSTIMLLLIVHIHWTLILCATYPVLTNIPVTIELTVAGTVSQHLMHYHRSQVLNTHTFNAVSYSDFLVNPLITSRVKQVTKQNQTTNTWSQLV